jgi:hypothetical protein
VKILKTLLIFSTLFLIANCNTQNVKHPTVEQCTIVASEDLGVCRDDRLAPPKNKYNKHLSDFDRYTCTGQEDFNTVAKFYIDLTTKYENLLIQFNKLQQSCKEK